MRKELKIISLSEIKTEEVKWLWYPYIPFGKVTIVQGDPGEGKTTFVLSVIAALTRGEALPECETGLPPMNVIYQTAEDGLADTIKPRLEAVGADCSRVQTIDDSKSMLTLTDQRLEEAIHSTDAGLLVLDPLQAYLGSGVDMHRANEIRPIMKKLSAVAERTGCAVVLIGHMNKSSGMKSGYRGLGSIDFTAAARSILVVGRIQDGPTVRVIAQSKNGYRADGRKISKAKTITVPDAVPRKQIEQYVNHAAVELERVFKIGYAEYGEMSFEEYSRHWLSRQLKYSQGTRESYRRILQKVYPYIGDIEIAKLRPLALENMLAELRKMQHHGKFIKESTVQKYLTVVSAVLSDAKRNEIIQKNPARMIDLPQCEQSKQFVPTDEEAQLLLTEFCNLPLTYETYYVLAMFTGCRRGELCALKWSDVTIYDNYDWATINISRSRSSVPGKGIVEGSTKSGRSRTVAVDSDIAGLIACLYTEKEREANERGEELSEYIFTNEHGKLIHPDTFSKTLRKIYDSIGLPHEFHLHTLRHYYVTTLLHSGVDKQTVADLVGHCDTSFLERTYCHPRLDKKRSAAEAFAAVQFGESIRSRP